MLDFRLYFRALLSTASVSTSDANPVVNEILASNQAVVADPQGEFDDCVEIFNPEDTDLDLRGYFFSDDADDPTQWTITGDVAVAVPARGYLLLWLDSQVPSPPEFNQKGGPVAVGFNLKMSAGTAFQAFPGQVHFTLDGNDPADPGTISLIYTDLMTLNENAHVLARTKNETNDTWGSLRESIFLVGTQPADSVGLVISEIHYNPDGSDDLEFIELTNRTSVSIDLTGVRFSTAVDFVFQALDLQPGASVLVVEDEAAFRALFASLESPENVENIFIAGQWSGRLNNAGDTIELRNPLGDLLHRVSYGQDGPWPSEADGKGFSLELRELRSDPSIAANWRLSSFVNGTPGAAPSSDLVTVENWLALYFSEAEQLQPEVGGILGDPDRDGISNLLEFGFGSSPRVAETVTPVESAIEVIEVGGVPQAYQTLTFNRVTNSVLQFALQESNDLES